jgi:hypothetical protein
MGWLRRLLGLDRPDGERREPSEGPGPSALDGTPGSQRTRASSDSGDDEDEAPFDPERPIPLPLDGRLDLHPFHPRDVKPLLEGYLEDCRAAGVLVVEVVHGKGTGALRRTVHTLLQRLPAVESFATADEARGGWGVTIVRLRPPEGVAPR